MREDDPGQRAPVSWPATVFRRLLSAAESSFRSVRLCKQTEDGGNHLRKDTPRSVSSDRLPPELLRVLEKKAQAYGIARNSWEGYAIFLAYVGKALQRIPTPTTVEESTVESIDRLFSAEMAALAEAINTIFAQEGIEELATYLPDTASRR